MTSEPPAPLRHASHRARRIRLTLLWLAFGVAAVALTVAVHRLYETVRKELEEQGEVAMRQERERFAERVRTATEAVRTTTIRTLAGFHVEGLGYALRRWDEGEATVVGTFQWDGETGFLPGAVFPPEGVRSDELAGLWRQFREWRAQHPNATKGEPADVGAYHMTVLRTLDNPLLGPGELGYQAENLDMLKYAGRPSDPWTGWAGNPHEPTAPWVFWYQPGPGAPIRGCFLDIAPLVAQLRGELADARIARIALGTDGDRSGGLSLAASLPGFALTASHGDLFVEKESEARLAALAIGLLLGFFVLGAAFLAIYSQREIRDAEHKRTFVAQVSHELRTPLTSIQMFADMLAGPELTEEKRLRFAGTIGRESRRLGALIERLLRFNALEKGGPTAAVEAVDVGASVRETLEEMDGTLRAAGMRVESELTAPVRAMTDRSALKQALLNLLDNALKYARDGGVIRLSLAQTPERATLRVSDEGPGVPRELGPRVFEPFVQGGVALTDQSPGIGLGLSIARGVLRQAGGDLVLVPAARGAVFEIRLPLAPPS